MRYPKTIPMPGPDEFCRGSFRQGSKCCLLGWVNQIPDEGLRINFRKRIADAIGAPQQNRLGAIANFNDKGSTSDAMLAEVWRKVARSFGYKVENKPWRAKR